MTFADLVKTLDAAIAPILIVLEKGGDQFMTSDNNTVQVFRRDSSPLGFSVYTAHAAASTVVQVPNPVAAALAASQATLDATAAVVAGQ